MTCLHTYKMLTAKQNNSRVFLIQAPQAKKVSVSKFQSEPKDLQHRCQAMPLSIPGMPSAWRNFKRTEQEESNNI